MRPIYRKVPGYPLYRAGDNGTLWRYWPGRKVWKRIKGYPHVRSGHLLVSLSKNGQRKMTYLHQVILMTFVGPKPPGMECCHEDGNCLNNKLSNLSWETHSKNQQDRIAHTGGNRGSNNGQSRYTEEQVVEIRRLFPRLRKTSSSNLETYAKLHRRFPSGSAGAIRLIVKRETWAWL